MIWQAYAQSMKAETHDMITATGYRLIATTTAQMDQGLTARLPGSVHELPHPLEWDTDKQLERDAKLMVTVRCLKLQPSTPFQHARDLLWRIENYRSWHVMPFTNELKPGRIVILDGGMDENPRFFFQIMCNAVIMMRCGYESLILATSAAGFTPLRLVEFGQCHLSTALDGAYISSDTFGVPDLDKVGKGKSPADVERHAPLSSSFSSIPEL